MTTVNSLQQSSLIIQSHCVLAPLISGIFKGLSKGSRLHSENWAARELQLQAAVSPRSKRILKIVFAFSLFCLEVESVDKNGRKKICKMIFRKMRRGGGS